MESDFGVAVGYEAALDVLTTETSRLCTVAQLGDGSFRWLGYILQSTGAVV